MSEFAMDAARMVDMLPDNEKSLACELLKRLVLAWDPDYTKLTEDERATLDKAMAEMDAGDTVRESEIDWGAE